MQRANERRNQLRRDALGWSFLLPSLLFLGCFTIYPIVKAIINSFQKVNLGKQTYQFIGLKNYTDVFNDKVFITVLGNTFKFALFVIPLSMVIGFFLAMLVKREARGVCPRADLLSQHRAHHRLCHGVDLSAHADRGLYQPGCQNDGGYGA